MNSERKKEKREEPKSDDHHHILEAGAITFAIQYSSSSRRLEDKEYKLQEMHTPVKSCVCVCVSNDGNDESFSTVQEREKERAYYQNL